MVMPPEYSPADAGAVPASCTVTVPDAPGARESELDETVTTLPDCGATDNVTAPLPPLVMVSVFAAGIPVVNAPKETLVGSTLTVAPMAAPALSLPPPIHCASTGKGGLELSVVT